MLKISEKKIFCQKKIFCNKYFTQKSFSIKEVNKKIFLQKKNLQLKRILREKNFCKKKKTSIKKYLSRKNATKIISTKTRIKKKFSAKKGNKNKYLEKKI